MDEFEQADGGQENLVRAITTHKRTGHSSNINKRGAVVVIRPGALDYRQHPSLAGDQRIAYAGGAFLEKTGNDNGQ